MAIPAYYSLIQRGSSGPDVALVQTWLNGLRDACTWHDILKVDGHFGTASEKAVTEFQLRNKLTVDGKVGANTWNAIYAKYTAAHGLHVPYPGIVLRQGSEGGTVRLVQQKLRGAPSPAVWKLSSACLRTVTSFCWRDRKRRPTPRSSWCGAR